MFEYGGRRIELLSLIPRASNGEAFWQNALETIRSSDRHGCSGILILTGNEIAVEPWLIAQAVAAGSAHLQPLVAVNPVYMHPFTVARMIASFALAFRRRVRLNLVTGTSLSHLAALGDGVSHDERYDRPFEYASIVDGLLQGVPLTVQGRYYAVDGLQLRPALDPALRPHYYVAGQSDAAARVPPGSARSACRCSDRRWPTARSPARRSTSASSRANTNTMHGARRGSDSPTTSSDVSSRNNR